MAFAAGSVSFQRFFVGGRIPSEVTDTLVEALNSRAFGKLPTLADQTQVGWIGPRHLFEAQIDAERIAFGRFVHVAMRVDRLRVPPNVVKAYVRMEEDAALEAGGRPFLSKAERRKSRETAELRAEKELKSGDFRRSGAYPVLIDLDRKTVYLASLGASLADKLMLLFRETFDCSLEPAGVERVAARRMGVAKGNRALEHLTPFHLVRPPETPDEAGFDAAAGDLKFLGREFLTWLWCHCDTAEGMLRVTSGDEVSVLIERVLRLTCDFGVTGADVVSADHPGQAPESRAALRAGKQPVKMGLVLGAGFGDVRLTLDATRFTVSGLTLTEDQKEKDAHARIEARFEAIADTAELLDALLEVFLSRRTAATWSGEVHALAAWAGGTPADTRLLAASA